MINPNRVVSVTATDLLTLYGTILKIANVSVTAVEADDPGVFKLTSGSGNILANEPVKSLDFGAEISTATLYFVADVNFEGFTVAGVAVTPTGAEVENDRTTLYTASLSGGAITIAKVGF